MRIWAGLLFFDKTYSHVCGISLSLFKRITGIGISRFELLLLGAMISTPFSVRACVPFTVNVEVSKLEKGLPMLATIAGGAPMIGFLGTVIGMVEAFFNMAKAGSNIDITLLSGGIYTAMVTTVAGLIVGILAYFGYNYLTSKVSDVVYAMERTTVEFMDMLQNRRQKVQAQQQKQVAKPQPQPHVQQ